MSSNLHFYYAAAAMIAAICLGGGTVQGLWSDHLVELMLLPAMFMGYGQLPSTRLSMAGKVLAGGIAAICLLQFVPLPATADIPAALGAQEGLRLWSPAPGRSLESALFALSATGFALYLSRFTDEDQFRLYRVFIVGLLAQLAAAVVQLSFDRRSGISGILPFEINAGLFANENHLTTLVYMAFPLFAYRYLVRGSQPAVFAAISVGLVAFLFALGSRAGIVIGPTLFVVCFVWFFGSRVGKATRIALLVAAPAIFAAALLFTDSLGALDDDLRARFLSNTVSALSDHWILGAGLGAFVQTYPAYEPASEIGRIYANHAHNDLLELLLETGLAGAALAAIFGYAVLRGAGRSLLAQAAAIAIGAVLVHSLMDYPLRTFAIAIPFAWLSAIVLSAIPHGRRAPETARDLIGEASSRPRYEPAPAGLLADTSSARGPGRNDI